mgnify:CR=1 FL=1|tara:strand:+ start:594 stop:1193 length:600 start_codon:yes stop_codon:yes gene_type:complete
MKNKRVETKHLLRDFQKLEIINKLEQMGFKSIHIQRNISSIYYDNYLLESYLDSVEGNLPRKKIRVRSYDNFEKTFFLEKKEVNRFGRFKSTKKIFGVDESLIDEIYKMVYPVVKVNYKRLYFQNKSIRITLDFDINYKSLDNVSSCESTKLILETKLADNQSYQEEINNFRAFNLSPVSFSKYKDAISYLKFNESIYT